MSKLKPRIVSPTPKVPLRIAIVGAGRLGTALGIGLAGSGVTIVAAVCRRLAHARAAAQLIGGEVVPLGVGQLSRLPEFDVALITTPDDAIVPAAASLARVDGVAGHIILHASGSLPSTILRQAFPKDVAVGSMHPLLAISDPRVGAAGFRSAVFCLEGEPPALRAARRLVASLGAEVVSIKTERKALYHAAAVMAAGHAVSLFDLATKLMERCGPDARTAARMLSSLFRSATKELGNQRPSDIMTGPFARGDAATIENHLGALRPGEFDAALSVYLALGDHAIVLAEEKGIDPVAARSMRAILGDFTSRKP